ncbi:YcnI family protein [Microbacterium sp. NPDC096154]|uniref:YcnI family protein n=1 Tax=Microbacterium sp. NPDC096154 TaxID=3155549 RepID=UPI003321DACA
MSTTPASRRPASRRIVRAASATALAAGLVLAAPLAASAHVTVTPDSGAPAPGGYDVLTFAFSHGCDGSPTTALQIDVPDGLDSVSPTIQPGWTVDVERSTSDGLIDRVTYTADEPVPSDLRATVELGVKYAVDASGTLAFPVEQVCAEGSTSWSELAADGEDPHALDHPAPVVTLAADAASGSADSAHAHADEPAQDGAAAAAPADPLPIALGAGGLIAGVAALVVSVLAWRRTRG